MNSWQQLKRWGRGFTTLDGRDLSSLLHQCCQGHHRLIQDLVCKEQIKLMNYLCTYMYLVAITCHLFLLSFVAMAQLFCAVQSSLTMVTANRPTPAATGSARSTGTMVRSVDQCPCTLPSEGLLTFSLF